MTTKKRSLGFWISRILLVLIVIGGIWLVNLIWFRPFNIRHFYDKAFVRLVLQSPELVTQLGIPFLYNLTKDKLDDQSDARLWKNFRRDQKDYATLLRYDFTRQSPENQLNTVILRAYIENQATEGERFFYHDYPVNQLSGVQSSLPSLLVRSHTLATKSDIKAYIARLDGFKTKFTQVLEGLEIREAKGIIPPRFVISRVVDEMKGFVDLGVENNVLFTNFRDKISTIEDLTESDRSDYLKQVAQAIEISVFPAYQLLIGYHERLYAKATTDDGVWKLPDGEAYYRYCLKVNTTTDMSPEEVHQIGLSEVERIEKDMWAILKSEGYTDTTQTIGAIMQGLSKEERFLFPDSDSGKLMLLAEYQRIVGESYKGLAPAFDILPKSTMTVQRIPPFMEIGSGRAMHYDPAMDGSKGGIFVINLRNVFEHPKYSLKTLSYHEGIPGHDLQRGLQMELKGLPVFRKVVPFNAFLEGWALYAEQLAWELGYYENDPFGNLGRLQEELFRACRLVVDPGIHFKKWTREEAIRYMVDHSGLSESAVVTEIERYIVDPGQACAYKIGMLKILELREKARHELGNNFDLRKFHRVVLLDGCLPLDVLEQKVDEYIQMNQTTATIGT